MHSGSQQSLVQCSGQSGVITDSFTGGLHFRRQVCVHTSQLGEGECRSLNIPTLLFIGVYLVVTLFLQAVTQDHLGGDVCQRVTACLGDEGYGTGRSGVNFDNEYVVILIHDELDVVQAHDTYTQTQLYSVVQDGILNLLAYAEGGVYADGVTGVYAGTFYVFHNTGNEYISTVADSINFQFLTGYILVNQYGLIGVDFYRSL